MSKVRFKSEACHTFQYHILVKSKTSLLPEINLLKKIWLNPINEVQCFRCTWHITNDKSSLNSFLTVNDPYPYFMLRHWQHLNSRGGTFNLFMCWLKSWSPVVDVSHLSVPQCPVPSTWCWVRGTTCKPGFDTHAKWAHTVWGTPGVINTKCKVIALSRLYKTWLKDDILFWRLVQQTPALDLKFSILGILM